MAYARNPFLERVSERTSDQEFVKLFSPKILDRIEDRAFLNGVHVFVSPPGAGKSTLLRSFTPTALRAFYHARKASDISDSYQKLVSLHAIDEAEGAQLLGVMLSCASGYADLPAGATNTSDGLFRALIDCRIVLRTVRSLAALLGYSSPDQLAEVSIEYGIEAESLTAIPAHRTLGALLGWAEEQERKVYLQLDAVTEPEQSQLPSDVRFEGLIWLQSIRFLLDGKEVAPKRLLMVDDIWKLRRRQRELLVSELVELRPTVPVWLADRSTSLGEELISPGAREGRDVHHYHLDDLWSERGGQNQFKQFAQNVLDRRLGNQSVIPTGSFAQYLREELLPAEVREDVAAGIEKAQKALRKVENLSRYSEWISHVDVAAQTQSVDSLRELYVALIMVARDQGRRQLALDIAPLATADLVERDAGKEAGAAEIFMHREAKIPYYYGIERLCTLATSNIDELLYLAAHLYDGMKAKFVMRRQTEAQLSPHEQEKRILDAAKKKVQFVPKSHTEGARAINLLNGIAALCQERTFRMSAPYAPGVTGVRLSQTEMSGLYGRTSALAEQQAMLRRVLSECVAENLLVTRSSAATGGREDGTVFYLNRTLCAAHGLPLAYGGWQDVSGKQFITWIETGARGAKQLSLEVD